MQVVISLAIPFTACFLLGFFERTIMQLRDEKFLAIVGVILLVALASFLKKGRALMESLPEVDLSLEVVLVLIVASVFLGLAAYYAGRRVDRLLHS